MMLLIANVAPLGPEWLDHPLKGEWADQRECHICGNAISAGMPYRRGFLIDLSN
jgi:hypothetical protein